MWTSTLELDPKRIVLTQLLGRFWPGAYFSPVAPLRVQNVPRAALGASNWVRVRNRLAGICGSDLHLIYARGDLRVAPAALPGHQSAYLGHEVVGEVIEIGDDVQHLRIGDRVALQYHANCLSTGTLPLCHFCAAGNYNFCERGELLRPLPLGGGWSEEMLLPEQQLYRLPTDLNDEQAVMLEPTAVALHAVLRRLPQAGERVLVIGAGTIGLLTVAVVRALAPQARVSVLARYPFQVEQATRLGAEHIIYPQDSYQGVQQATQAEAYRGWFGNQMLLGGFDVIYDTIGSQNTLHHALRWTRAGSTLVLVGIDLHLMHIDMTPLWYQEISLLGSLGHGLETWPPATNSQRSTFDVAAELIMQHRIAPEQLITHRFALTDYQHALMTAAGKGQNRAIKILFDYALLPASVVPNVRASRPRRLANLREQWDDLDDVPEASEPSQVKPSASDLTATPQQSSWHKNDVIEPSVSNLPATPQQSFWHQNDVVEEEVEEDTEKVRAIKKAPIVPIVPQMPPAPPVQTQEFSWASRASEAISGDSHQSFSWASRASEAISGSGLQTFARPEEVPEETFLPEEEQIPATDFTAEELSPIAIPHLAEMSGIEAIEHEEPVDEERMLAEPEYASSDIEPVEYEEPVDEELVLAELDDAPSEIEPVYYYEPIDEELVPVVLDGAPSETETEPLYYDELVAEESEYVEPDTAIEAMPEMSEARTEAMQPVTIEPLPILPAIDETSLAVPEQDEKAVDEAATGEIAQEPQEEPAQSITEEVSLSGTYILNNVSETTTTSNGKARQGTRKKRATKDGPDALEQVDAPPVERKRSRPRTRARKTSQEE